MGRKTRVVALQGSNLDQKYHGEPWKRRAAPELSTAEGQGNIMPYRACILGCENNPGPCVPHVGCWAQWPSSVPRLPSSTVHGTSLTFRSNGHLVIYVRALYAQWSWRRRILRRVECKGQTLFALCLVQVAAQTARGG